MITPAITVLVMIIGHEKNRLGTSAMAIVTMGNIERVNTVTVAR